MRSKFGLKDLVMLVMLVAIGVVVLLGMKQDDRQWQRLQSISGQLSEMSGGLARVQQMVDGDVRGEVAGIQEQVQAIRETLAQGIIARPSAQEAPATGEAGTIAPGLSTGEVRPAGARDESWARPDVAVVWSQPYEFSTDPTNMEKFARGGEFVEIFEGQPPTITPYRYADVYGRRVMDLLVETLGYYDPNTLKLRGKLAEAWQYDPNGMWARVKIQPRARFSDGAPVTAEDVRWTFHDLMFNPEIEADRFRSVYNAIKEVKVISDKIVEFEFKEPRFDNLSQAFGFLILPKHFYTQFTPTQINQSTGLAMGSGPFKLARVDVNDQWTPPADIVLVRNEQYWGPKPPLAGVRWKTIQDSLGRLVSYTNGTGDLMRPTSLQFEAKASDPAFVEKHRPLQWYNMQGGYGFVAWQCGPRNGKLTPFSDQRVRLAMTHLIDRERILRDIYKGLAKVATGPFSSQTPQANQEIKPWPYDMDKAKALLAEAGWQDRNRDGVLENEKGEPFTFQLTFGQGSESTLQMVTYIKDQCAAAGIRCELNPIDWSILSTILDNRDFDAITFAWSASAPENDPEQIWHSKSIQGQGDNFIQWASADADRLIEEGRRTIDDEKRMKVWQQFHSVLHAEQPYTFMMELPWLRFANRRVENINTYKSGLEPVEFFIPMERQAQPF